MPAPARPEPCAVVMRRPNVDGIPQHFPSGGFRLRPYRTGDEAAWTAVELVAEKFVAITPDTFRAEFGNDEARLAAGMIFLEDSSGRVVGTATAWNLPDRDAPDCGRVHWVALVDGLQGAGLGKAIMTAVCNRLREQKFTHLVLGTHVTRIPAINLYLSYGFAPDVRDAADLAEWRKLAPQLKYPVRLPDSAP